MTPRSIYPYPRVDFTRLLRFLVIDWQAGLPRLHVYGPALPLSPAVLTASLAALDYLVRAIPDIDSVPLSGQDLSDIDSVPLSGQDLWRQVHRQFLDVLRDAYTLGRLVVRDGMWKLSGE